MADDIHPAAERLAWMRARVQRAERELVEARRQLRKAHEARDEALVAEAKRAPLREIGERFGVSKARAGRILKEKGVCP